MSIYNNDVTYNEKWDTMENNAALKVLTEKYFDRSVCWPSCPVAWAPEVLSMLEKIDKKLGIAKNTQTINSCNVKHSQYTSIVLNLFYLIKAIKEIKLVKLETSRLLKRAIQAFTVLNINPILNKIQKPKFELSQIKEKFGSLVVYYSCPKEHEQYIENLIHETEMKLASKGAYYTL